MPTTFSPNIQPEPEPEPKRNQDECFLPGNQDYGQNTYSLHANVAAPSIQPGIMGGDDSFGGDEVLDRQVRDAQLRLRSLREEQEELARKRDELQQLEAKQQRFHDGRRDALERLTLAIDEFEENSREAERTAKSLANAAETFRRHKRVLSAIRPEEWPSQNLQVELDRAIELIEEADEDYEVEMRRLEGCNLQFEPLTTHRAVSSGSIFDFFRSDQPFFYWLKNGLAFSIPLLVLGLIILILCVTALGG